MGDEILQASLINDLKALPLDLTVLCSDRLIDLFQQSIPEVTFKPQTAIIDELSDNTSSIFSPLIDFAGILRINENDFPQTSGYLKGRSQTVDYLRSKYVQSIAIKDTNPLFIGISWESKHAQYGSRNTIPLAGC